MKLEICRVSGLPVKIADIDAYNAEFSAVYDRVQKKLGINDGTALSQEMAGRMNRLLTRIQRTLLRKFPVVEQIEYPKSARAWKKMLEQYGALALARTQSNKLAVVILDAPFNPEGG